MERKALVCITPQSNSKRLIDKGFDVAKEHNGELMILHVLHGSDIFSNENTGPLLDALFEYGKIKGGAVYALSGEHIFDTIKTFAKDHQITDIVLGEPPDFIHPSAVIAQAKSLLPHIHIHILEREQKA